MGQRRNEFDVPAPPRKAVILGIIAALGAGLLWGLISVITGYRLAWAAVLVGLAIGFVIRDSTLERTHRTARLAMGLTLAALVLGRVVLYVGGVNYVSTHEAQADPTLVYSAVMAQLEQTMPGQLDPTSAQRRSNPSAAPDPASNKKDDKAAPAKPVSKLSKRQQLRLAYLKMHETAMERIAAMSREDKRQAVQWYIDSSNVPVVRMHSPSGLLGRWDVVWWILAIIVAYLLTKEPPQREDDAQEDDAEEIELDEELIR